MAPDDKDPALDATIQPEPIPQFDDTLEQTPRPPAVGGDPTQHSDGGHAPSSAPRLSLPDYDLKSLLGRGGMGDVVLARDKGIGRDVAIKHLRVEQPTPDVIARFLREARIQARLEHPSIVPVHELGVDERGLPYFTMKKLTGTTLFELLASPACPPRPRVLRIFAEVCTAVEFAHSRGVVHRDLKPSNIMVGDFGEVYVLDWGLARVVGERESQPAMRDDVESLDGVTQAGAMLGTPGYMAPEQAEDASNVGQPADVYALGAILFEILAGENVHPRGTAAITSTLKGNIAPPGTRRPEREVPPELDELCGAMLVNDPDKRPSVKDVAEALLGFLDGDRDTEKRRELATAHVVRARTALASADPKRRAEAMQAAGHALVLDPESGDAAEIVRGLMFAPLDQRDALPQELQRELDDAELAVQRRQGKAAIYAQASMLVYVIAAASNGIANVGLVAGIAAYIVALAAFVWRTTQRPARPSHMVMIAAGNALLAALLSRTYGSLLIVPAVTCVMALSLTSYPLLIDRVRIVIVFLVASWTAPVVLEQLGVLAPTWAIGDGSITATSHVMSVSNAHTTAILVVFNIATIIVIGLFASALATSRRNAQRQVEIQAWHLRQLLPTARGSVTAA